MQSDNTFIGENSHSELPLDQNYTSSGRQRARSNESKLSCYEPSISSIIQSNISKNIQNSISSSKLTRKKYLGSLSNSPSDFSRTVLGEKSFPQLIQKITSFSNIIRTNQDAKRILHFFPFKIEECYLLYRASQHKFRLKEYFEQCGTQTDTIIICLTTKDKIIGAFSPASHSWTGKLKKQQYYGEWIKDTKKESFIFSVTDNQKFILQDSRRALWRRNDDEWINFGDDELRIEDQANLKNNLTVINQNYKCQHYPTKTLEQRKSSCQRFNGGKDSYFRTKQWQVWKIVRKNKTQIIKQNNPEIIKMNKKNKVQSVPKIVLKQSQNDFI